MVSKRGFGNWVPYWAANTYLPSRSREAGVRVFLYDKGYLHSKTAITDGEICSDRNARISTSAASRINYELNAVIYDEAIAKELEADFNQRSRRLHRVHGRKLLASFHPDQASRFHRRG